MLARAGPVLARLPQGATMVEVGVSTALLAEHLLRTRPDIEWHGVDPWARRAEQRACYVASGDTHAQLSDADTLEHWRIARVRLDPFGERAVIHREWSPEAAARFEQETVDLVFLDGDHSYDGVKADLEAWWPVIKRGGWIGGHDWKNPDTRFRFGVAEAVEAWAGPAISEVELGDGLTFWVRKPDGT